MTTDTQEPVEEQATDATKYRDIQKEAGTILAQAQDFKITTVEQYTEAGEKLAPMKALRLRINGTFDPIITKANEAHKEALKQKRVHSDPIDQAERIIKRSLLKWEDDEAAKRRVEEIRLQALADKQAKKDQEKEAKALEKAGDHEAAEEVRTDPVAAPTIRLEEPKRAAGLSRTTRWGAEVTDLDKLIAAVAKSEQPNTYLKADMPSLNKQASSLKEKLNIPGVKPVKNPGMNTRV